MIEETVGATVSTVIAVWFNAPIVPYPSVVVTFARIVPFPAAGVVNVPVNTLVELDDNVTVGRVPPVNVPAIKVKTGTAVGTTDEVKFAADSVPAVIDDVEEIFITVVDVTSVTVTVPLPNDPALAAVPVMIAPGNIFVDHVVPAMVSALVYGPLPATEPTVRVVGAAAHADPDAVNVSVKVTLLDNPYTPPAGEKEIETGVALLRSVIATVAELVTLDTTVLFCPATMVDTP